MIPACCAFHEAGHALVAESAGVSVQSVTVHEDGSGGNVLPGLFRDPDSARWDARPLALAAGFGAELLYDPDPDRAWLHAEHDREILRQLGHTDAEIARWGQESADIISSQRPAWKRLAHLLAGGGTFDGATVRSALAGEPIDARHAMRALEQRKATA